MIEVLRQARNSFVWNLNTDLDNIPACDQWAKMLRKNIDDLDKAIAELESQEPVAYLCENAVGHKYFRWKKPTSIYKPIALYTHPPQRTEQEPVAWRTFDGEGGYDYRSYEDNESYADEWDKRNPNHKGWVDKLYTPPPPCPTCEALARTVMMDQTGRDA